MTAPEKCPKCGAGSANKWATGHEFQCNTLVLASGDVFEGLICVRTQRDQLASQVADLEVALMESLAWIKEMADSGDAGFFPVENIKGYKSWKALLALRKPPAGVADQREDGKLRP